MAAKCKEEALRQDTAPLQAPCVTSGRDEFLAVVAVVWEEGGMQYGQLPLHDRRWRLWPATTVKQALSEAASKACTVKD